MSFNQFPYLDKYPHDLNVDYDSPIGIQNTGKHYSTIFCENVRKIV